MNNIVVSIVIPVYNAELYLERCIDSLIPQLNDKFELLLIDDGSVDSSGTICDDYAKEHSFIHVVHKQNGGVSSARNVGIDKAQGRWITFIDSDDYVSPNYFQGLDSIDGIDLIVRKKKTFGDCDAVEEYQDGDYSESHLIKFLNENMQNELFRAPWGKFFSLHIINQYQLRFDSQYHLGEDALFVLDYLSHIHSLKVSGCSFYNYFLSGDFVNGRYKMPTGLCLAYVKDVLSVYERTTFSSGRYLSLLLTFNTGMIIHHSPKEIRTWLHDKSVRKLWRSSFKYLSIKTNLKYLIYYFKSFF